MALKNYKYLLAALLIFVMIVTGCSSAAPVSEQTSEEPSTDQVAEEPVVEEPAQEAEVEEPAAEPIKVALVLSGPISDASWNAAAYNAVVSLEDKYNLQLEYTENVGLPDIEPTYRGYADAGFDIIIGHGFQFGDPAIAVGPDYPDTKWGVVMGIVEAPNVVSLNFSEEQTSYIAGFVAGKMSESGVIGGIGGMEIPSIIKMMEAYKLGAKEANPDVKILVSYVGSWDDPTAGYEAALAQISQGADVLFPSANLTSTGVYKAIQEKGVYAIGSEGDQCAVAPGSIIATITDNLDRTLELMIQSVEDGSFSGGVKYYGIADGAISYFACPDTLPSDVESAAEDINQQIKDGTLEIPVILEPTN